MSQKMITNLNYLSKLLTIEQYICENLDLSKIIDAFA